MADETQPVNVGTEDDVTTGVIKRIGVDDGGELVLHPVGQEWTISRCKENYPDFWR